MDTPSRFRDTGEILRLIWDANLCGRFGTIVRQHLRRAQLAAFAQVDAVRRRGTRIDWDTLGRRSVFVSADTFGTTSTLIWDAMKLRIIGTHNTGQ